MDGDKAMMQEDLQSSEGVSERAGLECGDVGWLGWFPVRVRQLAWLMQGQRSIGGK